MGLGVCVARGVDVKGYTRNYRKKATFIKHFNFSYLTKRKKKKNLVYLFLFEVHCPVGASGS